MEASSRKAKGSSGGTITSIGIQRTPVQWTDRDREIFLSDDNIPSQLAVVDFETTGVDVADDRIVTAFVGLLSRNGEMLEKKSWLINPGIEIAQGAIDVHGVTNERAQAEGVPARDGVFGIMQALDIYDRRGIAIAGYNLAFDLSMLYAEGNRYGFRPFVPRLVVDGFVIDKALDKYRRGKRTLGVTAAHYGVDVPEDLHDAEVDCRVAGELAFRLLEKINKPLKHIHDRCVEHAETQAASYQEYLQASHQLRELTEGHAAPHALLLSISSIPPTLTWNTAKRSVDIR